MPLHTREQIEKRRQQVRASGTFRRILDAAGLRTARVLDVGCGYGEYLVLFGPGSIGITTTAEEVAYGTDAGIDIRDGNAESLEAWQAAGAFGAVWANNLFEHLLSPHAFLMETRALVGSRGRLVLGVPVIPAIPAFMRFKKFRGSLASNHIGFYTRRTLRLTVERAGWTIESVRPFWFRSALLDRLAAPLAPHLYVTARRDDSFSYPLKKRREWDTDSRYARLLALGTPEVSR